MRTYYVYILASASGALYTGVTNNLARRVGMHKQRLVKGFTQKYNITRLVYFETGSDIRGAIAREKQIKGWLRSKKIALIESVNPGWKDLGESFVMAKPDEQKEEQGGSLLLQTPDSRTRR